MFWKKPKIQTFNPGYSNQDQFKSPGEVIWCYSFLINVGRITENYSLHLLHINCHQIWLRWLHLI
jgi:hypothetical protein